MIKRFNYLNKLIISLFGISVIYFSFIFFFANINGDWRHYIDSEILWPYNTLLILSGEKFEFDAYGFFYFILEYKFFQILDLFNLLITQNIEDLNNGLKFTEKLENLIFAGRWFNVLIIYITLLISFLIFNNLSKNLTISFILVLVFMFSPGMIQQISHARVDVLVSTLLLISFFYLTRFIENKNISTYLIFLTFFLLSVFTKVQAYIFLFLLILASLHFINNKKKIIKIYSFNLWINLIITIYILVCLIYPLLFHRHAKFSIVFLYSQIIMLNLLFYILFRKYQNTSKQLLFYTFITFLVISIFILVMNNLPYMSGHAVRLTFFEPMEMRMYITENKLKGMDVITLDIQKNLNYFYLLFKKIIFGFISTFHLTFSKFNSNLLLIFLNLFLIFYNFYQNKKSKDILLLIPILCFFVGNGVNNIRGQGYEMYLTYSEFFLFIPICIYIRKCGYKSKNFIKIFLIITLFLPIIFSPQNYNQEKFLKNNRIDIWCPGFMGAYTKQISQEELQKICP
jgi:hypothetical protein